MIKVYLMIIHVVVFVAAAGLDSEDCNCKLKEFTVIYEGNPDNQEVQMHRCAGSCSSDCEPYCDVGNTCIKYWVAMI